MPLVKCSSPATKGGRKEANYLSLGRPLRPAMNPSLSRLYKSQLWDSKVFSHGRGRNNQRTKGDGRSLENSKNVPKERVCSEQKKKLPPKTLASGVPMFRGAVGTSSQTLFHATGEVLLAGYQGRAKGSKLSLSGPTPTACHVPRSPPL